MGKIKLVAAQDAEYVSTAQMLAGTPGNDSALHEVPAGQLAQQQIRTYFPGGDDEISLLEVKCPPNMEARAHAHEHDELRYVLEGELIVGNRHYGAESAVFIPAQTLYNFAVGPEGVRYLNIKPCFDRSFITKEQFMARRNETGDWNHWKERR
jgi:hypothetical protein